MSCGESILLEFEGMGRSPPGTIVLMASPGSIVPPVLPWSVAYNMDLLAFGCALSLHPFGFIGLCIPPGSTLVLCPTSSASVLRHPDSTTGTRHHGSTRTYGVTGSLWLFSSAWVSKSPGSTDVGQVQVSIVAPSSIGSTVGLCQDGVLLDHSDPHNALWVFSCH